MLEFKIFFSIFQSIGGKLNNPLVASSLVATYCKSDELCNEQEAVKGVVKRITSDLGSDCSGDKQKVRKSSICRHCLLDFEEGHKSFIEFPKLREKI